MLNLRRTLQNSPAKKTRIYRDDMELFFLEPQSRFQVAGSEFFFFGVTFDQTDFFPNEKCFMLLFKIIQLLVSYIIELYMKKPGVFQNIP